MAWNWFVNLSFSCFLWEYDEVLNFVTRRNWNDDVQPLVVTWCIWLAFVFSGLSNVLWILHFISMNLPKESHSLFIQYIGMWKRSLKTPYHIDANDNDKINRFRKHNFNDYVPKVTFHSGTQPSNHEKTVFWRIKYVWIVNKTFRKYWWYANEKDTRITMFTRDDSTLQYFIKSKQNFANYAIAPVLYDANKLKQISLQANSLTCILSSIVSWCV